MWRLPQFTSANKWTNFLIWNAKLLAVSKSKLNPADMDLMEYLHIKRFDKRSFGLHLAYGAGNKNKDECTCVKILLIFGTFVQIV